MTSGELGVVASEVKAIIDKIYSTEAKSGDSERYDKFYEVINDYLKVGGFSELQDYNVHNIIMAAKKYIEGDDQ